MPVINVPAAPAIALFMNVLRDRRLSSGSIMGRRRSYQILACLELESVPPSNHRVTDRDFINVAAFQFGEEIAWVHGAFFGRFFSRQASARCQDSVMPHSASLRWNSGDCRGITSWNVQRIMSR